MGASRISRNISVQDAARQAAVRLALLHDNYEPVVNGLGARHPSCRRSHTGTRLRHNKSELNEKCCFLMLLRFLFGWLND